MSHNPLISIIVPVYNVEKYLHQCLNSILEQMYTNLEIILIDDGSTDSCPQICDEYAEKDSRVRVIRIPNGGVSDARNAGIDVAAGEYLTFIDSDDWIAPDMVEFLYDNLINDGADISCCRYYESYIGYNAPGKCKFPEQPCVLTNEQAAMAVLNASRFLTFMWSKLYRKEIFNDIRFPAGKVLFEDLCVIVDLFMAADKVSFSPESKYFYRQRKSSRTNNSNAAVKDMQKMKIYEERQIRINENYPGLKSAGEAFLYKRRIQAIEILKSNIAGSTKQLVKNEYLSSTEKTKLRIQMFISRIRKAVRSFSRLFNWSKSRGKGEKGTAEKILFD